MCCCGGREYVNVGAAGEFRSRSDGCGTGAYQSELVAEAGVSVLLKFKVTPAIVTDPLVPSAKTGVNSHTAPGEIAIAPPPQIPLMLNLANLLFVPREAHYS